MRIGVGIRGLGALAPYFVVGASYWRSTRILIQFSDILSAHVQQEQQQQRQSTVCMQRVLVICRRFITVSVICAFSRHSRHASKCTILRRKIKKMWGTKTARLIGDMSPNCRPTFLTVDQSLQA